MKKKDEHSLKIFSCQYRKLKWLFCFLRFHSGKQRQASVSVSASLTAVKKTNIIYWLTYLTNINQISCLCDSQNRFRLSAWVVPL